MFLVTSITMLRERTSGTLERLMTMPLAKLDILLGYGGAFALVAAVQARVVGRAPADLRLRRARPRRRRRPTRRPVRARRRRRLRRDARRARARRRDLAAPDPLAPLRPVRPEDGDEDVVRL